MTMDEQHCKSCSQGQQFCLCIQKLEKKGRYDLCKTIKAAKRDYRDKIKEQLEANDTKKHMGPALSLTSLLIQA